MNLKFKFLFRVTITISLTLDILRKYMYNNTLSVPRKMTSSLDGMRIYGTLPMLTLMLMT